MCILYIHLGITGQSALRSKAQGLGEYAFATVASLQPYLSTPIQMPTTAFIPVPFIGAFHTAAADS